MYPFSLFHPVFRSMLTSLMFFQSTYFYHANYLKFANSSDNGVTWETQTIDSTLAGPIGDDFTSIDALNSSNIYISYF